MSFLTTHPEALAAAAGDLQAIGASLTGQNAAAAGPITGLAPAAADEVSMLQATQFSAYGTLYEQISAQAAAMQEMFVHTLRASADSYGFTETANSAAATSAAATSGVGTATGLGAAGSGAADPTFGLGGIASNSAILAAMNGANLGSAASAFTGLGTGYITNPSGVLNHAGNVDHGNLIAQSTPGTAPAAAGAGQGSQVGRMSAPPGWAAGAAPAAEAPQPTVAAAPATAEPRGATTVPAGAPAVASSDRGGYGFGRPRYGVKPVVMPRKPIV